MKKVLTGIAKAFGWILMVWNWFSCAISVFCIPVFLTAEGADCPSRIAMVLCDLLFVAVFGYLGYLGYCLKSGKKPKAPWAIRTRKSAGKPEPAPTLTPKPRTIPEPNVPESDYLADITFIKTMTHIASGTWQQYDVLLDARPYGWETMKDWADYLAEADLEGISQVEIGTMGGEKQDVTSAFALHGNKCKETPELATEQGMLSVAGFSKNYGAPMKIVWVNQTRTLRLLTLKEEDLLMRKYAETLVRRTFGTENAMKLGKSAAKQAPAKPKQEAPAKAPEKPAAEKPAQEKQAKLNLGNFPSPMPSGSS